MLYLLSYPKSGNTFLRYCIEKLTRRSTLGCFDSDRDTPIYKRDGVKRLHVNENKGAISRKAHKWSRITQKISEGDNLILLIRDYKECLVRHNNSDIDGLKKGADDYFNLIKNYENFKGNKLVLFYEDLIDDDKFPNLLENLRNFLNLHTSVQINEYEKRLYIENVDWHRENSLNSYIGRSATKGKKKSYHKKKLTENQRFQIDNYLWDKNSFLCNLYLLNYREQNKNRDVDMRLGFHGDKKLINVFEKLGEQSDLFVETGTFKGFSVGHMANKFPELSCYSCEIKKEHYENALKYCGNLKNVNLYHKGSVEFLEDFFNKNQLEDKQILYWLDAHGFGFEWPLKEEIELVTGNNESSVILIDDFKVPGAERFGVDEYEDQECSFEYIEDSIQWEDYKLYYPTYNEISDSAYHPLRGWGVLTKLETGIKDIDYVKRVQ